MVVVALCSGGLEKLVANEIRKSAEYSPARIINSTFGKVRFETDLAGVYHALLSLRTADRLLFEAASFHAADFDALFEGTRAVSWEDYIPAGLGLVVDKVRSNHSRLAAETSIQAMVHKAAADRLCGRYGQTRLPENGEAAELRVYVEKDTVQILIDLSGKPLFKRGYRVEGGPAPLRESAAAALLLQSLWRRKYPLYDPFCGSGTIVIEAALYAWDAAPGLGRRFAISNLAFADDALENVVKRALIERIDLSRTVQIYGSDSDSSIVEMANANLRRALELICGSAKPACMPKLWWRKMEDAKAPAADGFIITNPPYGIRLLDKEGAESVYCNMAVLKNNFPSWKINVLSAHAGFEAFFGENASRCKKITAGAAETYFYEYNVGVKQKPVQNKQYAAEKNTQYPAKKTDKKIIYTW
jgi:putative N6-adenine-specific DNA methylase